MKKTLLVATKNKGKAEELRQLLPHLTIETLRDHPELEPAEENAETFADNARVKAEHIAQALGVPVLADDSGLCVDALAGGPGVRSARYAEGTDADRTEKLLAALKDVPADRRGAHFACAIAFAVPGQETLVREGKVEGHIASTPSGAGGFGYDPVFVVGEGPQTMAELTMAEKNERSHRARALQAMLPELTRHFS